MPTITVRVEKVKAAKIPHTRYVGILECDGVVIFRSTTRPYRSCARAAAVQERADLEKRGEL